MKEAVVRRISEGAFQVFDEVYIFGSLLSHADPHDVDVLLVYSNDRKVEEVIAEADRVRAELVEAIDGRVVDLTTLSRSEFEKTRFLDGVSHECIWSNP